ncbi:response regulator transcription factor [Methylomarinum sp. Ch1-1]|uniref:Response regulator transcription factor n=1 Tax=Methylomarinum roseum TaxID=3067653 RepID=A0AAU7NZ85_9GAMM|nr:response regulator transcription factor [Methylomarinum sp. Ch1-1]MDP4521520.1 response regulator transcription factor [Methylomarinum sp. Ch1-1]
MRLLIIEDNQDLALELADYFEDQGNVIDCASDGVTGLHLAVINVYDVLILDLSLPGMDGLELCRRLREDAGKWLPVLMLTARDTLDDRIRGFEHGADDYLVKPFSLKELQLRVQALARRGAGSRQAQVLHCDDLRLNVETREVSRGGKEIELTVIEFQILELLMRRSPKVVSRNEMTAKIWGDHPPDADVLKVHIHHLRNAIDKPFAEQLLHTVRGVGYKLQSEHALPSES